MNQDDIALLLAILGGTYLLTALIGKVTGDAARDVRLMAGVGITLAGLSATLAVV
jgi:hypothetical protein